jgi:hypothetical protein
MNRRAFLATLTAAAMAAVCRFYPLASVPAVKWTKGANAGVKTAVFPFPWKPAWLLLLDEQGRVLATGRMSAEAPLDVGRFYARTVAAVSGNVMRYRVTDEDGEMLYEGVVQPEPLADTPAPAVN